jgi:hypothetical protein
MTPMNGMGGNGNGASPAPKANPTEVLVHLENAGPHMTQHLQALQGDPTRKEQVDQFQKQLQQLGKISDQLHQQLTEQLKAKADQPQPGAPPDPEMQAKMAKVAGDLH